MSYDLPTPYELSRIAAALCGHVAGERPKEAVHEALVLWHAAADKLRDTKTAFAQGELEKWKAEKKAYEDPDDQEIQVSLNKAGESKAMEWLRNNAKDKRDQFKSEPAFFKAWCRFHTYHEKFLLREGGFTNTESSLKTNVKELRQFLSKREEERRHDNNEAKKRKKLKLSK